jgi:uncharacterized RDD family membrane protein YckC
MPLVFPESGVGSLAPMSLRALALFLDWVLSGFLAMLFTGFLSNDLGTVTTVVWLLSGVLSLVLFSFTPGQLAVGLRVIRTDADTPVGVLRALGRGMLIFFVVPVFLVDKDGRGYQDRLTGTAVVRQR